jgi:hypothetical protein
MQRLEIGYNGDTGIYLVALLRTKDGTFKFSCTCEGAKNGYHCKHRMAILEGDYSRVAPEDRAVAETIRAELEGSEIQKALHAWRAAEADVKKYKRAFGLALMGQ